MGSLNSEKIELFIYLYSFFLGISNPSIPMSMSIATKLSTLFRVLISTLKKQRDQNICCHNGGSSESARGVLMLTLEIHGINRHFPKKTRDHSTQE